jgi:hypothetical protein
LHIIVLLTALTGSLSCVKKPKKLNTRITFWRKDKIPYGTAFAFNNLKYIFPKADIEINTHAPSYFSDNTRDTTLGDEDREAYIILGQSLIADSNDINAFLNYASNGNQLFISAFNISDSLLSRLKCRQRYYDQRPAGEAYAPYKDSMALSILEPGTGDSLHFAYPGFGSPRYFSAIDSEYTWILGRDEWGKPNFICIRYTGGGAIYLHLAPLAFSNFFLLHRNNKAYYERAMSYLPSAVKKVRWDDYFRYPHRSAFSALRFILSNAGLRWAFWLLLALFSLIYIFESKRKQRMVPVIPFPGNPSVDFVKTVGTLYYQQKDNQNLAQKMVVRFLEHVRTRYQLSTNFLDDQFVTSLARKSGFPREQVNDLVYSMHELQLNPSPADEEMILLSKKMELFYKQ